MMNIKKIHRRLCFKFSGGAELLSLINLEYLDVKNQYYFCCEKKRKYRKLTNPTKYKLRKTKHMKSTEKLKKKNQQGFKIKLKKNFF